MNRLGLFAALAGLAFACWVVWKQDLNEVAALLAGAGLALFWLVPAHLPCILTNAKAWGLLLPGRARPAYPALCVLMWVRESINHMLPVGRVGGEVVAWRLLRLRGVRAAPATGSLLADMALSIVSQLFFVMLGLALLAGMGGGLGIAASAALILMGAALAVFCILALRGSVLSRAIGLLNRVARDRLAGFADATRRLDTHMRRMWRLWPRMAVCVFWQFLGWVAGAITIWVGANVLGHPLSWAEALLIEALIQTLVSAAFVVPGALGVQEAGFIGLALLVGMDPAVGAALALTRRFRDVVVFLPGLAAWVWLERVSPSAAAPRSAG